MDLSQLQKEHDEWLAHNFPHQTLDHTIFGAVEEIGELCHHHLKDMQDIRGGNHYEGMLDSIADCVIFLAGTCTHLGVDFGDLVTVTWQQVKKRDWIADPQKGAS